jgi:hypothetical protein
MIHQYSRAGRYKIVAKNLLRQCFLISLDTRRSQAHGFVSRAQESGIKISVF